METCVTQGDTGTNERGLNYLGQGKIVIGRSGPGRRLAWAQLAKLRSAGPTAGHKDFASIHASSKASPIQTHPTKGCLCYFCMVPAAPQETEKTAIGIQYAVLTVIEAVACYAST